MEYTRVYVTQDDDGHNYVIPYIMKDDFDKDLENGEEDEYEKFNDKYGEYMTGGDVNLVELYVKNENPNALSV